MRQTQLRFSASPTAACKIFTQTTAIKAQVNIYSTGSHKSRSGFPYKGDTLELIMRPRLPDYGHLKDNIPEPDHSSCCHGDELVIGLSTRPISF